MIYYPQAYSMKFAGQHELSALTKLMGSALLPAIFRWWKAILHTARANSA